ncbi:MAG: hypothetical protein AB7V77_01040 [Candidatus Woesearchaeota archaeon]
MNKNIELKEQFKLMHNALKVSFSKVKLELNEHLDSINQNTDEIQTIYNYLSELDAKIEKLNERIDEVTIVKTNQIEEKIDVKLSVREEEIFLALYTAIKPMNVKEIARFLGLTEDIVNSQVYKLLSKGIPIKRELLDNELQISLDSSFKDLQARKNLIPVNQHVLEQFVNLKL